MRCTHNEIDSSTLDRLLDELLIDAHGDDEQLWAFRQSFEDNVELPADAFMVGEPVLVVGIDYDGNERRGLTATCQREDHSRHVVAAVDLAFADGSTAALYAAAYRKWCGLEPRPANVRTPAQHIRQHKVTADDLDLDGPIELVALAIKERAARCRLLGSERVITLRARGLWDIVPAEIVTICPRKQWCYAGHPYLSGEIESYRLDVAALRLLPLRLSDHGSWDPKEHYWGEKGESIEAWARPIIARGPRPQFEMEQVVPGADPDDPFSYPITESIDLKEIDDDSGASEVLMNLCQADLRCLDAHAHLGNSVFENRPQLALRHYEAGVRIGEFSLADGFEGVLPWGLIDNRPFLRCMQGYGLCLWRLGRIDDAERVLDRMLWLNPADNQGMRFLLAEVQAGESWEGARDGEP